MIRIMRVARLWWDEVLSVVWVADDVTSTIRTNRLVKAETKQLTTSARTRALTEARKGCTHMPLCPSASAPDRTKAFEIYADDACVYLCNGLVLSTRALKAPDTASGLHHPMPQKETRP